MFFVIELLPSIVKVVSKAGQYDLRVYHQEEELKKYLHSQEYQDYCYKMLQVKYLRVSDAEDVPVPVRNIFFL